MSDVFERISFSGKLRPSQHDAVEVARDQLLSGERQLHIVAPPGSGKTVMGLYFWAHLVRKPAVVLSPNSAIQSQWAARLDLFGAGGDSEIVSTDPRRPALLTSLTYQSVTLPRRGGEDLDEAAVDAWCEKLVETEQADNLDQALIWLRELETHNADYYDQRLSIYRKLVRDTMSSGGEAMDTLHASSLATLQRLRDHGVGMLICDECHHLMGHWGRVLAGVEEYLGDPIIVGLTATPPDADGFDEEDKARYDRFFGPVDYSIPVPALVRDGFLSPYRDLAYFVRPQADELAYIANTDSALTALVDDLCVPHDEETEGVGDLLAWLTEVLGTYKLPTGYVESWRAFEKRDEALALAGRVLLLGRGVGLPAGADPIDPDIDPPEADSMEVLAPVLDRYVRHGLRPSPCENDHRRADEIIKRLRTLGVQITETGSRACASPVGRVMAYSSAKAGAIVPILLAEMDALDEDLRAIIVTDYEQTSAVTAEIAHLLDDEAGGAVAAFRSLLTNERTDELDPVLVTGSTVLVDDDLSPRFLEEANAWLATRNLEIDLRYQEHAGFNELIGRGAQWCPRVYVQMITDLFQHGVTRCLVGTRGLLGEGWDATRTNVLIDLTTVTTSMSVNQLRGRSIRLDHTQPEKTANNWDVVCIAPEFRKGLDDYRRFMARHRTLFGVTDDGAIEKGVGHVHPAFTEIRPEGIEEAVGPLSAEMISRASARSAARELWAIGTPYHATPIAAAEALRIVGEGGFPPFTGVKAPWNDLTLAMMIGRAVLNSLREVGEITSGGELRGGQLAGGYVRVFIKYASRTDRDLFAESVVEVLGPLRDARYIIPRQIDVYDQTWLSRLLPDIIGKYFRRRRREMAMWHAVPTALARNKERVAVFEREWNRHVSPGKAVFAQRGQGEQIVAEAIRDGLAPSRAVHRKEVFL
ncbi:MAG: DEAD/DEAH box helicase family protein [Phycisphaerae bacterium]|nr:DEAD/DEAH box helicase family protein [Phycisphaerae bacterium]